MNGNFATSFNGIAASPLEYVPASRSPNKSRARNDRCGFGAWLSRGRPAEKSPLGAALMAGGTKSAVVRSGLTAGSAKSRTSMYGLFCTRVKATIRSCSTLKRSAA